MLNKLSIRAALVVVSALSLSACVETGRDTITESLGSSVQFNKNCQTVKVEAPAGCKRVAETGEQADQAVTAYQETVKQTSTLRVKSAPIAGGTTGASPQQ